MLSARVRWSLMYNVTPSRPCMFISTFLYTQTSSVLDAGKVPMTLIISNLRDVVAIWRFLIGQSLSEPSLISKHLSLAKVVNKIVMASLWMPVGRVVFVVLLLIQGGFFVAYSIKYKVAAWAPTVQGVLFAITAIVWLALIIRKKAKLSCLFYVWVSYVITLVVNIGILFGTIGDKLDSEKFLGPNVLKGVLCVTPPLLLLLLHNADDLDRSDERKDLVSKLSYQMAIDLFDVVDMIDIVLEDKRHGSVNCSCANVTVNETQRTIATSSLNTIPESFGIVMVAVASLSLLMSLWQLFENKLSRHDTKIRFRATVLRNLVEIALVNFAFLIIRLVVYAKYRRDESIFIAKNIISIVLSILEINAHCESHSVRFWSELCKSCFGLRVV